MLLSLDNVSFGFLGDTLLENLTFSIHEGDKIGLIGANGEGKTTLIRLLVNELEVETGTLFKKNGIRIGYLAQNGGYDSTKNVFEEMCEVFEQDINDIQALREVENQISKTEMADESYKKLCAKYEFLNQRIASRDSYQYEVRIRTVLNGMGFQKAYDQKISTMSGGEKTRLKLCKLLLEAPDLLILDEPTNHLDMKTLFWLEEYLAGFKGAILTVSHDRYFLDKTVTKIFEIEQKKLSVFKGNYTKYKQLKQEKTARIQKEYEKQQETLAHMQEYVDKNLVRASTTKMAQSRRLAIEKIERIEKPKLPPPPPRFSFTYNEKPYEKVLDINGLNLIAGENSTQQKTLIENLCFTLNRGEKCAVVGDNGTGKSTLLKLLKKGNHPAVRLGRFVKIAYYDQENANLNAENEVLYELWARHPLFDQTKIRSLLATAGLGAEDMQKKVAHLSGGERAKLGLTVLECEKGNTLFLDEPTNHLDLPARESLETALKNFDGTLLFVSHDRYFIRALADKILELEEGKANAFVGGYDDYLTYKNTLKFSIQQTPAPIKTQDQTSKKTYKSKEVKAQEAEKRNKIYKIEKEISVLEEEERTINEQIALPEISSNFLLLTEKCNRLEQIKTQLDELYASYEILLD